MYVETSLPVPLSAVVTPCTLVIVTWCRRVGSSDTRVAIRQHLQVLAEDTREKVQVAVVHRCLRGSHPRL